MENREYKKQVFYIHGGESFNNYDDYLRRLKNKEIRNLPNAEPTTLWSKNLEINLGDNFELFAPSMPNSQNAKYYEWKIWFERHFEYLNDGVILLGWSLGAMFLVKYLSEQKLPVTVKALVLLAPASYAFSDSESGEDGGDFNCDTTKIENIVEKIENIVIFHSKDDFVIPYDHSEKLIQLLPKAELITFEDKNHFLIEEFPELLEKVKSIT